MKSITAIFISVMVLVIFMAESAFAVTFSSPVGATASSYNDAGGSTGIGTTIDESGLDVVTGAHTGGWNENWLAGASDTDPWVVYALGAIYDMNSIRFWNGGRVGNFGWGITQADIWVSTDGVDYTLAIDNHVFSPDTGANLTGDFSEIIPLTGHAGFIKLDDMVQTCAPNCGFAIAEFKFDG